MSVARAEREELVADSRVAAEAVETRTWKRCRNRKAPESNRDVE
jgi:hypothetical protein